MALLNLAFISMKLVYGLVIKSENALLMIDGAGDGTI